MPRHDSARFWQRVDKYPTAADRWLRQVAALTESDGRRDGAIGHRRGAAARRDLWVSFVNEVQAREVAEIGVYRGTFATRLLRDCPSISSYYMVDPWRHLDDWHKPANKDDEAFERLFQLTMRKTRHFAEKRVVLRGTTTQVSDELPDEGLDFVYIDGDHTLRGITVDLLTLYPKVRSGGWIGGDDFRASIWQHTDAYEPTFVFPFAVYFAEAVRARIYGLPYNQFLLEKSEDGYEFVDLTGRYARLDLRRQLRRRRGRSAVAHLRRKLGIRTRLRAVGGRWVSS